MAIQKTLKKTWIVSQKALAMTGRAATSQPFTSQTTGPMTDNCSIGFSAAQVFTVTVIDYTNGAISPSLSQLVAAGSTQTFVATQTVYANDGSTWSNCSAGTWLGSNYTTGPITTNCTIYFGLA